MKLPFPIVIQTPLNSTGFAILGWCTSWNWFASATFGPEYHQSAVGVSWQNQLRLACLNQFCILRDSYLPLWQAHQHQSQFCAKHAKQGKQDLLMQEIPQCHWRWCSLVCWIKSAKRRNPCVVNVDKLACFTTSWLESAITTKAETYLPGTQVVFTTGQRKRAVHATGSEDRFSCWRCALPWALAQVFLLWSLSRLFAKTGDQAIAQGYNSNCLLKQDSETSRFCKRNFVARIYTLETPLEAMSPSMLRVVHFFRNLNRSWIRLEQVEHVEQPDL